MKTENLPLDLVSIKEVINDLDKGMKFCLKCVQERGKQEYKSRIIDNFIE